MSFYNKELEKYILIKSYFDDNEILKYTKEKTGKTFKDIYELVNEISDEVLIKVFNEIKPKRKRGVKYDGDNFYGKYYTYMNYELKNEGCFDKKINEVVVFLDSLNEKEYEIVKAIVDVYKDTYSNLSGMFAIFTIRKVDVANKFTRNTGLSLSFHGSHWNKIIQMGLIEIKKKDFIISPEYIQLVSETLEKQKEISSLLEIEKEEKVPDDLFDTIIDHTEDGKPIEHIIKLKKILKEAIKNHIKDVASGKDYPKHILIVGDVAIAKTMFLIEIERLKGSLPISGDMRIGKAGLVNLILETKPKFLLIDEIQHLDSKSLAILLSLGETGRIGSIISKEQKLDKLNVMIIATTHPRDLEKIDKKTRGQGILDRFLIIKLPNYTDEQLIDLMKQVLVKRYNASEEIAEYIAKKLIEKGIKSIRKAIRVYSIARENKEIVDCIIDLTK